MVSTKALSKCKSGASDYGRGMTQSLPLSYWSPEKSYMTSSRMATKIYIAARFRVKIDHCHPKIMICISILFDYLSF